MRWSLKPKPETEKVQQLAKSLGVSETIAYLAVQRGIETYEQAKDFFVPNLKKLHDPFLMKDMDKAVARIEKALADNEKILVYGDYDVDGTTSVSLMATYLNQFSDNIAAYIPDRYKEGYGVSFNGIDFADDNDIRLIIALDCGIKAVDKVEYAKQKNIDFIICDHHLPGAEIPQAVAVLDPKRKDCEYPYKELCGCGVGFKLIQALQQKSGRPFKELLPYLDLVATAIAADIVPITGENRILCYHGLKLINKEPRPGLKAIITQNNAKNLTITDVVFIIAPRINAAGRMDHALSAVDLLMETELSRAVEFAKDIEEFNKDRKLTDRDITAEALLQIEKANEQERFTTVVYQSDWHKGVIGIVASRLTETYYRPTLVFTKSGDFLSASARSVKGFDIYAALEACSEHIIQFGGHKFAAGLTLKETEYEAFKQKFEEVVAQSIPKNLLTPEVNIDMRLDYSEIHPKLYKTLMRFAPFGPENPRPVFLTENLYDTGYARPVGENGKHLKCALKPKAFPQLPALGAIGFGLGDKCDVLKDKKAVDVVHSLDENTWNGTTSLQLRLRDLR